MHYYLGKILSSDGVTPFYKDCDMVIRTLIRVTAELVPLNYLDEVRLQFKIFCTESGLTIHGMEFWVSMGAPNWPEDWLALLSP